MTAFGNELELDGHDVPEEKIRKRWPRSIANLPWFAERCHAVQIFDNSETGNPVLIAEKNADGWHWHLPGRVIEIDIALAETR